MGTITTPTPPQTESAKQIRGGVCLLPFPARPVIPLPLPCSPSRECRGCLLRTPHLSVPGLCVARFRRVVTVLPVPR